jgi:outer membrane lipoprotein-sorting protein
MTCEEFRNKVVELFDTTVDKQTKVECEEHASHCSECKAYYEDLKDTFNTLQPRATLDDKVRKNHRKYWQAAAAIAIFLVGVAVGWSHFFSVPASANVPLFSMEEAIKCVQNVGSFQMDVYARTERNENFAYFNPHSDFVKINIQLMRQNDSTYYRVDKEQGKTIVCDGKNQYVWTPDGHYFMGNLNDNVLESFANLLYPERLLSMQESVMELSKKNKVTRTETDSTIVLITEGMESSGDLQQLLELGKMKEYKVTMQNVFSKNDGLLRSVKIWLMADGSKTLMMHIDDIRYNIMLNKNSLIALPQIPFNKWIQIHQEQSISQQRLSFLQKEAPQQAAQRIMQALITGESEKAKEALAYYKDVFQKLSANLNGSRASDFIVKKDGSYAGVYVFYTLTRPDGSSEKEHLAIRNDNSQHIWIVDGGL